MAKPDGRLIGAMKAVTRGLVSASGWNGGAFETQVRLDLLNRTVSGIRGLLPSFAHSIAVAVAGGPDADIRRIWYLCASAAFGRFRNRVRTAGTPVSMNVTWDITAKTVALELNYCANALDSFVPDTHGLRDPGGSGIAYLIRGPEQVTVGSGFNSVLSPPLGRLLNSEPSKPRLRPYWLALMSRTGCLGPAGADGSVSPAPVGRKGFDGDGATRPSSRQINVLHEFPVVGLAGTRGLLGWVSVVSYPYHIAQPASFLEGAAGGMVSADPAFASFPRLPDDGRLITTGEKLDRRVQPPKPSVDGHTRGSFLALIAQSLQEPCYLPSSPPCTRNPAASSGVFIMGPTEKSGAGTSALQQLWRKRETAGTAYPLGDEQGPDGYNIAPPRETNYGS